MPTTNMIPSSPVNERPDPQPLQPPSDSIELATTDDIYRGPAPRRPSTASVPHPPADLVSLSSVSSSSSSSSSSSGASKRIVQRALAGVVELAISRWARSSSSTTSSSSSSTSSSGSRRRSRQRRRRHNSLPITVDTTNLALERQAFERARQVPREFHLVLPERQHRGPRSVQTTSLQTVMAQLRLALQLSRKVGREKGERQPRFKRAAGGTGVGDGISPEPSRSSNPRSRSKSRFLSAERERERGRSAERPPLSDANSNPDPEEGDELGTGPGVGMSSRKRQKQPRDRPLVRPSVGGVNPSLGLGGPGGGFTTGTGMGPGAGLGGSAWWLDVASPSWEDMRAIGTLLHLHPLTLEDILQQDPREKIELFPRLGYYFIVFRALDLNSAATIADGGAVNHDLHVTNVYLTVFREGVCSFHFAAITEHADRVRGRMLGSNADALPMTSDMIAHGIMDSIVDAFIPFINSIEQEVEALDGLVSGIKGEDGEDLPGLKDVVNEIPPRWFEWLVERWSDTELPSSSSDMKEKEKAQDEKPSSATASTPTPSIRLSLRAHSRTLLRASRRIILSTLHILIKFLKLSKKHKTSTRTRTLLSMSRTRRMVILLARLLGPKNEILGHLRKRFVAGGELGAQLSDVQDHILSMHHSLHYFERVLAHSHPAYLSYLNVSLSEAKSGSDEAILFLSFVSIGTVCLQFTTGLFSMNVHIPGNRLHDPDLGPGQPVGTFHWFGGVISINVGVITCFILTVWYWRNAAKKKYGRGLQ